MDFTDKWIRVFCKGINQDHINRFVKGPENHIWHVFSYGLLPKDEYLQGEQAKKEFDNLRQKDAVYYVFYPDEERLILDLEHHMDSHFFDELIEVYVVAKDHSWTYIKTHESDFGPYFYRIK